MPRKLLGAVIAGGQSRRFGSDKAFAELDGRNLLDHAIMGLATQTEELVICGRDIKGYISLTDRPQPGLGPLGGLAAALHFAADHGFDAVLTSACDTPEVPANLAEALTNGGPAVAAGQPLFGYWPGALASELDNYLAAGRSRAVTDWAQWAGAARIALPASISNINTPADLAELQFMRSLAAT